MKARGSSSKKCEECSLEFLVKNSQIKKGGGRYCSRGCRAKSVGRLISSRAQASRLSKTCKVCGNEVKVKQSRAKTEGTYCSRRCMASAYSTVMAGASNPNFKNKDCYSRGYKRVYGQRRRRRERAAIGTYTPDDIRLIYDRQAGWCVLCTHKFLDDYHIDHVMPLAKGGRNCIGNLQLLCGPCNSRKGADVMSKAKRRLKASVSEDDEQIALMAMVKAHEAKFPVLRLLFHVPNGGLRTWSGAKKLKALGVKAGVPDLIFPASAPGYIGLAVELKSMTGYASREQKEWVQMLRSAGWRVEVCRGAEAAWNVIHEYVASMKP